MVEEDEHFLSASHRKCILLSETECHIINGEYWPSVVFVRTERSEVRTITTSGQYSQLGPRARLVRGYYYMAISVSGQYAANSVF